MTDTERDELIAAPVSAKQKRLIAQIIDGGDADLADYDPSEEAMSKAEDIATILTGSAAEWSKILQVRFASLIAATWRQAMEAAADHMRHTFMSSEIDGYACAAEILSLADKPPVTVEAGDGEEPERCPDCGYTEQDKLIHGDHHLCKSVRNADRRWQRLRLQDELGMLRRELAQAERK